MSTSVIRVPTAVHQEASRVAALVGEQPGELLAKAWREYLVNHRDDFASDLEQAARLMRNAALEDLVTFVQDSHHTVVAVDPDELEAARRDPKVHETLDRAQATYDRFEREGRNL